TVKCKYRDTVAAVDPATVTQIGRKPTDSVVHLGVGGLPAAVDVNLRQTIRRNFRVICDPIIRNDHQLSYMDASSVATEFLKFRLGENGCSLISGLFAQ